MGALLQEIRYGLRVIAKNPGFAAVAIAVLALGIGANTAIFSVVNAVLMRPLPFPEADRIVSVPHTPPQDIFPGRKTFSVSPANYLDWKAQNDVFSSMAAWTEDYVPLTGMGRPEDLDAAFVTSEFFTVLGVKPVLGRTFLPGEDEPGHKVAVLSEELWKSRFGANPATVGGTARDRRRDVHDRRRPAGAARVPRERPPLAPARLHCRGQGHSRDPRLPGPRANEARRRPRAGPLADEHARGAPGRAVSQGQQGLGGRGDPAARGARR